MSLLALSIAYIRARALNAVLNLTLLALGVGTIVLLLLFSTQLEERLLRDGRGFDLVIGAKGSPLQLILSSIYQVDFPTGNIPLAEAARWRGHPLVASAIPIAMGDNFSGSAFSAPSMPMPNITAQHLPLAGSGRRRSRQPSARRLRPQARFGPAIGSSAATASPAAAPRMPSTPTP
jgi:hypothetical protein